MRVIKLRVTILWKRKLTCRSRYRDFLTYMVNESFLHNYHSVGDDFLQSKAFKQEYGVHHAQAQYDKCYLYGILQSVTRNEGAGKKHVLQYKHTADGFLTWKDLVHDCDNNGSTTLWKNSPCLSMNLIVPNSLGDSLTLLIGSKLQWKN